MGAASDTGRAGPDGRGRTGSAFASPGEPVYETSIGIPRHGAGPREVARASEIWRLFQEVAMEATTAAGWPPERYRAAGTAFVIYGMTAVHHREVGYGQALRARTWVYDFKRATLTRRQIRLEDDGGPVASCTQQWVHTDTDLSPVPASPELLAAFPPERPEVPAVTLPDFQRIDDAPGFGFAFTPWHVWMDPLAHVNHPTYVDFCDESTCRALADAGLDPQGLVPVAEHVRFKSGACAGDEVVVRSRLVGRTARGDAVFRHDIGGTRPFAQATTVRRHVDVGLVEALG
ncbi:MAG: acyl-CoA thioesterase [Deltaproteobacteria bacterium]|nr:MAG: acyl-CoA thioesterase [Deltaproteobacteria bacterium]